MAQTHRRNLGQKFSEGARLSWVALDQLGWDQSALRKKLKARGHVYTSANIVRWLYGDRRPESSARAALQDLLGVDWRLWDAPSTTKRFHVPLLDVEAFDGITARQEPVTAPQTPTSKGAV